MRLSSSRRRVKLQERVVQAVVKLHNGSLVTAPIAVVWRRKDGDDVAVVAPVVPLHHQLVRTRHKRQPVRVVKCLGNILPKRVTCTARRDPPPAPVHNGINV